MRSPAKKKWCCTTKKMGCEGASPPSVDAGYGMVWKRVQVHGYWVWQAVSAGGPPPKMPYDCHAGLYHHQTGWSPGKKDWCCWAAPLRSNASGETWLLQGCRNQHLGCMTVSASGAAAAAASSAAAAAGGAASGGSHPPGMAGSGMMWKHEMLGGHWQWAPELQFNLCACTSPQVQHHIVGHMDISHMKFDCSAGFSKWQHGWSSGKKDWQGVVYRAVGVRRTTSHLPPARSGVAPPLAGAASEMVAI